MPMHFACSNRFFRVVKRGKGYACYLHAYLINIYSRFVLNSISKQEEIIKDKYKERRVYESVDDSSLSQKSTKKQNSAAKGNFL